VYLFQRTTLAMAALLAIGGGVQAAEPSSEIQTLRNTVDELRKQVQELRSLVKGKALTAQEPTAAEGESQESLDARTPATKADVQGLRTDIENYKYDQSRLQERNIPSVTRNTKIGGSITVRYEAQNPGAQPSASSSGNGASDPRSNGFTAPTFGLNFAGNLFRDYAEGRNLTYRLALTSTNSATTSITGVNLTDAYIRYSFQPASGNPEDPLGTITVGQQTVPFGQDAQALDAEVKAVIGNAGFVSGLGLGTRQIGLLLSGDYDPYVDFTNNYRAPLVAYNLGLFNGNGNNKSDNNDQVDIAGRLVFTLPVDYSSWFRQLQVGASLYRGHTSLGPGTATTAFAANQRGSYNRYGFDINWTHLPYSIAYEWAYGKEELARADSLVTSGKNADGFRRGVGQYINLGYTWGEQFLSSSRNQGKFDDFWPKSYQAFLRFDSWDPNRSGLVINDRKLATTLGLNVFFAETTKFQINYIRTRNQLGTAKSSPAAPETVNLWQAQLNASF
jgi:Phosphate-selective porin O and P